MSISSNVEVLDKRTLIDPVDINTYEKQVGAPFIDSLTGLPNHGFFIMTLDRETKRSERFGSSISVGLINIDCFRLLNKSKGSGASGKRSRSLCRQRYPGGRRHHCHQPSFYQPD